MFTYHIFHAPPPPQLATWTQGHVILENRKGKMSWHTEKTYILYQLLKCQKMHLATCQNTFWKKLPKNTDTQAKLSLSMQNKHVRTCQIVYFRIYVYDKWNIAECIRQKDQTTHIPIQIKLSLVYACQTCWQSICQGNCLNTCQTKPQSICQRNAIIHNVRSSEHMTGKTSGTMPPKIQTKNISNCMWSPGLSKTFAQSQDFGIITLAHRELVVTLFQAFGSPWWCRGSWLPSVDWRQTGGVSPPAEVSVHHFVALEFNTATRFNLETLDDLLYVVYGALMVGYKG